MADIHALPGVSIPDSNAQPDPDAIKVCRDLLTLAEEGGLVGVAFVYVSRDGRVSEGWSDGDEHTHRLMAGITYLQYRFAKSVVDDSTASDTPSDREPA